MCRKCIFKIKILSGNSYIVIGSSLDEAYKQLRNYLDKEDKEFSQKRDLASVEVLAEKVFGDDYDNIFIEIK